MWILSLLVRFGVGLPLGFAALYAISEARLALWLKLVLDALASGLVVGVFVAGPISYASHLKLRDHLDRILGKE